MDECYESGTDGERLVCKIASKVLNTKGATWKATGSSAESSLAADPVSGILCISLKLQIRAVVWKNGAHQPGGPPLRTTTAHHFRQQSAGYVWNPGYRPPHLSPRLGEQHICS